MGSHFRCAEQGRDGAWQARCAVHEAACSRQAARRGPGAQLPTPGAAANYINGGLQTSMHAGNGSVFHSVPTMIKSVMKAQDLLTCLSASARLPFFTAMPSAGCGQLGK